jgi:tRNA U34 5-methylaminomethyl-2-thiouridine-forming methyltransferase MnmC
VAELRFAVTVEVDAASDDGFDAVFNPVFNPVLTDEVAAASAESDGGSGR